MTPASRLPEDRVILLSGVGAGLGRKLALRCAAQGARLVLGARSADCLTGIVDEIAASGGEAVAVPTDVADRAACRAFVDRAIEAFGKLDGLVNSAFYFTAENVAEADLIQWRAAMEVTCFGGLEIAQSVPLARPLGMHHQCQYRWQPIRKAWVGRL